MIFNAFLPLISQLADEAIENQRFRQLADRGQKLIFKF
jgi:hypothetical protein